MPALPPLTLQRADVEVTALAADHDRQPRGEFGIVVERAREIAAVGAVEQFEIAARPRPPGCRRRSRAHRRRWRNSVRRRRAGSRSATARACGEAAQHLGLVLQRLEAPRHVGEFAAQAAEFADPHDRLAADGAAHRLDRRGRSTSSDAAGRLRPCRAAHRRRGRSAAPAPAAARCRTPARAAAACLRVVRQQQRGVAADLRPVVAGAPTRSAPAARRTAARGSGRIRPAGSGCRRAAAPPAAAARCRVRISRIARHDGEAEHRQRHRQRHHLVAVEIGDDQRGQRGERIVGREAPATTPRAGQRPRGRAPATCTTSRSDASTPIRLTWIAPNHPARSTDRQRRRRIAGHYPVRDSAGKSPDRERRGRAGRNAESIFSAVRIRRVA